MCAFGISYGECCSCCWNLALASLKERADGERSVGVISEDVTEAGEKSGELGDASRFRLSAGFLAYGAGELRFSVRRSCSTC